MGDEVFSSRRVESDDSGRVVSIGTGWQLIKLRSGVVWGGCHWINESILCGGKLCPACRLGYPKRPYAFALVDRPGQAVAVIRLSASDVAELTRTGSDPSALVVGDSWKVRRPADRKPIVAEFNKKFSDVLELSLELVQLEVLRLHRIRGTIADVRERAFFGLVCARAEEACGGRRLQLQ